MTREEAIQILQSIEFWNRPFDNSSEMCNKNNEREMAISMALASLKTDEAYQLEYENRDFVEIPKGMTNGEVIQTVFPNISVYEHGSTYSVNNEYNFNATWWNALYQKGDE